MKKLDIFIIAMLIILAFTISCTEPKTSTKTAQQVDPENTIENELKAEIASTSALIAIQSDKVLVKQDQRQKNYILVKNAYDKKTSFNLQTRCETCLIDPPNDRFSIEPNSYKLIKLDINAFAEPGTYEQQIKITDDFDNAYAFIKVSVTIKS